MGNQIERVKREITVSFEGVTICIEHTNWVCQPDRTKHLSFEIYNGKEGDIKKYSKVYDFIIENFKKSDFFKEIVKEFKL